VCAPALDERGEPLDDCGRSVYDGRTADEIVELVRKVVGGRDEEATAVGPRASRTA